MWGALSHTDHPQPWIFHLVNKTDSSLIISEKDFSPVTYFSLFVCDLELNRKPNACQLHFLYWNILFYCFNWCLGFLLLLLLLCLFGSKIEITTPRSSAPNTIPNTPLTNNCFLWADNTLFKHKPLKCCAHNPQDGKRREIICNHSQLGTHTASVKIYGFSNRTATSAKSMLRNANCN